MHLTVMRLIPIFVLALVTIQGSSAQQFYQYLHPYYLPPVRPSLGKVHSDDPYTPYQPYSPYQPYYVRPQPQDGRFFGLLAAAAQQFTSYLTSTVSSTSTSTVVTTCTVSTSSVCSGRRRRYLSEALLGDDDAQQEGQFIAPSVVEKEHDLASTSAAQMSDGKKRREAQYDFFSPVFRGQQTPNDLLYPSSSYQEFPAGYYHPGARLFYHVFSTTTTSTTTITTTVRSTPSCSFGSSFNTC